MTSNSQHGAMLSAHATEIEAFSGEFVDVLRPDPSTIHIEDITQHLSLLTRYNGAINRFYSIAEHACFVMALCESYGCEREILRGALLHDAAEAYLQDLTSPLKYALRQEEYDYPGAIHRAGRLDDFRGAYDHLTRRMEHAIAIRFGVDVALFDDPIVKLADMHALKIEAKKLTRSGGSNWRWNGDLPNDGALPDGIVWTGGMYPNEAHTHFANYADRLGLR